MGVASHGEIRKILFGYPLLSADMLLTFLIMQVIGQYIGQYTGHSNLLLLQRHCIYLMYPNTKFDLGRRQILGTANNVGTDETADLGLH